MAIKPSDINRRNKAFWDGRAYITYDLSRSSSDIERFYGTSGRFGTSGSMGVSGTSGSIGAMSTSGSIQIKGRSKDTSESFSLRDYIDLDTKREKEKKSTKKKENDESQKEIKYKRSIEF